MAHATATTVCRYTGAYSIILTKAAFLAHEYFQSYSAGGPMAGVRAFVDEHRNCEDIAMQVPA